MPVVLWLLFVSPMKCKLHVGSQLYIECLAQGIAHHRCLTKIWINEFLKKAVFLSTMGVNTKWFIINYIMNNYYIKVALNAIQEIGTVSYQYTGEENDSNVCNYTFFLLELRFELITNWENISTPKYHPKQNKINDNQKPEQTSVWMKE